MDVRCEGCQTEYEFDDALVSARGTRVKCTQCGSLFRVQKAGDPALDIWLVRTASGRELRYTSLATLQRGILAGDVRAVDLLVRGNDAPRSLASITEFAPLLGLPLRTQTYKASVAPPAGPGSDELEPSPESTVTGPTFSLSGQVGRSLGSANPAARWPEVETGSHEWQGVSPSQRPPPVATSSRREPAALSSHAGAPVAAVASPISVAASCDPASSSLRTQSQPKVQRDSYPSISIPAAPGLFRPKDGSIPSLEEPSRDDVDQPPRRRVGGWVVFVAVAAGALAVGALWMRRRTTEGAKLPERVQVDLNEISRRSRFESALEASEFDSAEALWQENQRTASDTPYAMLAHARLLTRQADMAWLIERASVTSAERTERRPTLKVLAAKARLAYCSTGACAPRPHCRAGTR
jgi:predicted Zn finger-like uncharacterized protein